MKQDSDIQLKLDFDSGVSKTPTNTTYLKLVHSAKSEILVSSSKTSVKYRSDEELFEPIIKHASSLGW